MLRSSDEGASVSGFWSQPTLAMSFLGRGETALWGLFHNRIHGDSNLMTCNSPCKALLLIPSSWG